MIKIILTASEMHHAANVGLLRTINVITHARHDPHLGGGRNEWQRHIIGAMGEYVVARYLGLFWKPNVGVTGHAPDVGDMDVRLTTNANMGLKIQPTDPDGRVFWLVHMQRNVFTIKGWALAADGKKQEYWRTVARDYEAFVIPIDQLKAPEESPWL